VYVWELLFVQQGVTAKGMKIAQAYSPPQTHTQICHSVSDSLLHLIDGENLAASSKHDVMSSQLSSIVIDS